MYGVNTAKGANNDMYTKKNRRSLRRIAAARSASGMAASKIKEKNHE